MTTSKTINKMGEWEEFGLVELLITVQLMESFFSGNHFYTTFEIIGVCLKSFIDGAADCFDNRRGAGDFFLLLIS